MEEGNKRGAFFKFVISVLDIIVALLIILTSSRLVESLFGRISLLFGLFILAVSVLIRFAQLW